MLNDLACYAKSFDSLAARLPFSHVQSDHNLLAEYNAMLCIEGDLSAAQHMAAVCIGSPQATRN